MGGKVPAGWPEGLAAPEAETVAAELGRSASRSARARGEVLLALQDRPELRDVGPPLGRQGRPLCRGDR
eukprot:5478845-Alexandrium_andersonii.AAC.1